MTIRAAVSAGFLALLVGVSAAHADDAPNEPTVGEAAGPPVPSNTRALCGLFSYTNTNDGVASFGTVVFDGDGAVRIHLKVNAVSLAGGRITREVVASGSYTFSRDLMGTMIFAFPDLNIEEAHYDFVAVDMEGARPIELFGVLRGGGVNGQKVDPLMRRLQGCAG